MTFFDTIESIIRSGETCKIVYVNDGNQLIIHEQLDDLVRKDQDEFLVLGSGNEIRLDLIVSINSSVSPFLC